MEPTASSTDEIKTRSGRRLSATKNKRKRTADEDESCIAKKKMAVDEVPLSTQLENLKTFLGNKIDVGLDANKTSITSLSEKINKDLAEHKKETRSEIEAMKADIGAISHQLGLKGPLGGPAPSAAGTYAGAARRAPTSSPGNHQDSKQYWRSRRCARLSPVSGDGSSELWAGVEDFFFKMMKIPTSELRESDVVDVRRVLTARGRQSREEVCVMFVDMETRDRIASYARNLSSYIENGKPTATFRHDIPSFLSGVHKVMLQYGFEMGKKHGKGFKRNVRFDDINQSFCIDVCLPGKNKWHTVTYEQAMMDRRERAAEAAGTRGGLLSTRTSCSRSSSTSSMGETSSSGDSLSGGSAGTSSSATTGLPAAGSSSTRDDPTWGRHRK